MGSLTKHLKLFNERNLAIVKAPTEAEEARAVRVVTEMLAANKYEPDADYRSAAAVLRVIDSTAVRDSKSPGQPYQAQGLPSNAQVLERYTKDGFAEHVLREWDSKDVQLKTFIKAEPTKRSKIEAGMPRIVTGMPLHKMIKNNCVFKNLNTVLVDNWKKSPVKFAFNPTRPGDIGHLASVFLNRMVGDSDKKNWDYNYFMYVFRIVEKVVIGLAERPADMSEEEFEVYLADARACFAEVAEEARYRTSNGETFKSVFMGIMKSGWLMTIAANSIGQLIIHVLVMIRMGYTDQQIMSDEFAIVVGGDDVIQTFPDGFDTTRYTDEMKILGFDVTEFNIHKSFNGCEFFSNQFKFDVNGGVWTFQPTRFTKHVAHLARTKVEDLANALSCHMINHVWDSQKFKFFDTMFRHFRKDHPELFPLNLLKRRQQLIYKVLGLESA